MSPRAAQIRHTPHLDTHRDGDWRDYAACAAAVARGEAQHDWWFATGGQEQADALAICDSCPVRAQCRQWAEQIEDRDATLGGLTPDQRLTGHIRPECGTGRGMYLHQLNRESPCVQCERHREEARIERIRANRLPPRHREVAAACRGMQTVADVVERTGKSRQRVSEILRDFRRAWDLPTDAKPITIHAEGRRRGALEPPAPTPPSPIRSTVTAEHGTYAACQQHRRRREPMCPPCKETYRAYNREQAARKRAGIPRKPPRRVKAPCGTRSAYKRHLAQGEEPCAACREANAAASSRWRNRKAAVPA